LRRIRSIVRRATAALVLQSATVTAAVRPLVLPGPYRAVVFDMDGLLLDTEHLWVQAEAELLERHGHRFTEADHAATHGRAMAESVAIYAERLGGLDPVALEAELLDLMHAHYDGGPPLQPGAEALVRALVGRVSLGVASSTTAPLVRLGLDRAGLLDAFETITSGADLGRAKPFPDAYLEACRILDVPPSEAIAFEDSPVGVRAAVAAGMVVVAVPDRPGVEPALRAAGAHHVVASLADVVVTPA
jgi:HAD superfamily hydrolase (TIGR01509 family)